MGKGKKTRYGMEVPFRTLQHLLQDMEPDLVRNTSKRFCFVLGAGASRASGIPSGQNLVDQWDEYIRERDSTEEYEGWQREMGIHSKQDQYAHYSDYYKKRFAEDEADGPTFIRNVTAKAEPSAGYLALANVMTETANNIVLTTNFDKLVETSIFRDTAQIPWVIGTAGELKYLDLNADYPKILKVHGDMFLDMRNTTEEIQELDSGWKEPLKDVLKTYHPVFIGYAGNDPSLMGYLESVAYQIKQPYWLYYREDELTERIWRFVANSRGCFVDGRIGFDGVLMHLFDRFHFQKTYMEQAKEREQAFQAKWQEAKDALTKLLADETESRKDQNLSDDNSMRENAAQIIGQETPEILMYNLWNQPPEEQKRRLDAALKKFPDDAYLLRLYAIYLDEQNNLDEAEKYYRYAIKVAPQNSVNLENYALFLETKRRKYDVAERYYKRAIKSDPENARILGNYALFLEIQKKNYDDAEKYYLLAIKAGPSNAGNLGNYAVFLDSQRHDYKGAEEYYRRAISVDPKDTRNLGNYALFLSNRLNDVKRADKYYKRVINIDPQNARNLGNYAMFLIKYRHDYDGAKEYYQRAAIYDPEHANILGYCAIFLYERRHYYDKTREYVELIFPSDINNLENYAEYLEDVRHDAKAAQEYRQRAEKLRAEQDKTTPSDKNS